MIIILRWLEENCRKMYNFIKNFSNKKESSMKPRIFISSTFYDFKYIREDISNFVFVEVYWAGWRICSAWSWWCIDLGLFKLIQTVLFLYEKYSLEPYGATLLGRRKCDWLHNRLCEYSKMFLRSVPDYSGYATLIQLRASLTNIDWQSTILLWLKRWWRNLLIYNDTSTFWHPNPIY